MRIPSRAVGGPGAISEATLFRQAQAGCLDSLNRLMARHEGLVHAVVRRHGLGVLSFAEALHAGRQGLWRTTPKASTMIRDGVWLSPRMRGRASCVRSGGPPKRKPVLSSPV